MYAFLLILGAAISVAGITLVGAGVATKGQALDASVITPGAVAFVGGLILIGLGLAVRVLTRIEQALAARPMPRVIRPEETNGAETAQRTNGAPRIPFPPKPVPRPQAALPETLTDAAAPAEDPALDRLREKFPSLVRLDSAPTVDATDVSLSPKVPMRAEDEVPEISVAQASRQATAPVQIRTAPRPEAKSRPAGRPERRSFDSFWPKKQRTGRDTQAAALQAVSVAAAEPELPVEPALPIEPVPEAATVSEPAAAAPAVAAVPISILKSGVVDGMAYTLYSDGSIEAQLPQGMLRFGSITELRNHIEQTA